MDPLHGLDNYQVCKLKMLDILTDLDLDDYIEDSAAAPSDASLQEAWRKKDRRALCFQ